MTAPRFANCHCGHAKLCHEVEEAPACCMAGCGCSGYAVKRPADLTVRPTPMPTQLGAIEALLQFADRSDYKRTQALGARITGLVADLKARVEDERGESERAKAVAAENQKRLDRIKSLKDEIDRERAAMRRSGRTAKADA